MSDTKNGDTELTTVSLPDGKPEEGERVEIEYRSKRSGNIKRRVGEVVSTGKGDFGRFEFKVREPDRDGLLWGFIDSVRGGTEPDNPPDLTGRLSRKTPYSKPHFQTHYGPITEIRSLHTGRDPDGE